MEVRPKYGGKANLFAPRGNTISPTTRTDLCSGKGRLNRCLEESRSPGKRRGRGGRKERGSLFVGRRDRYFSTGRDRLLSSDSKRGWRGRGGGADFRFSRGTRNEKTLRVAPCFVSARINRGHVDRFEEGNLNGADGTTKGHRIEGRSVGSRSTRGGACK